MPFASIPYRIAWRHRWCGSWGVAIAIGCGEPVPAPSATLPCAHAELAWHLPFRAGAGFEVMQGNDGPTTHRDRDRFSWDFRMPRGTPVFAAATGVVVEVSDGFPEGGDNASLAERANVVVVDHGAARFSVYAHLTAHRVFVREGQRVRRGELLALSGNSGYSDAPHLHFEVTDFANRSLPTCFVDVPGGRPVTGQRYVSANLPAPPAAVSTLPRTAFATNGILLDVDLPARIFCDAQPLPVRGRVTERTEKVVAFFLARGNPSIVRHEVADVDAERRFALSLDLTRLAGRFDFALVDV